MIIWLASYPRSGNTFFRVILNSVFNIRTYSIYNDPDIGADEKTAEVVGHDILPENFDLTEARNDSRTWFIKTHAYPDSRISPEDKVIYLIRDGRECTLSLAAKLNDYTAEDWSLDDVIEGKSFVGKWGEHVAAWDPLNRPNTLPVFFEKLVDDPLAFIAEISDFTGQKPIGNDIPSFETLQKINPVFFRSGKKDSWKEAYTQSQLEHFWKLNHKQMIAFGYTDMLPKAYSQDEEK